MKNKFIFIGVSLLLLIGFFIIKKSPVDSSSLEIDASQTIPKNLKQQHYIFDDLPAMEDLNSSVAFITGADDSGASFVKRDLLVLSLKAENLNDADFAALMSFMSEEPTGEGRQLAFLSLKNDVMSFLIESERYPLHLAAKMTQNMTNPNSNQIWREYIAQYIPDLIAKLEAKSYSKINAQLIDALWEVTSETKGALAGTALIGLHKLVGKYPQIDTPKLAELTARIAHDKEYDSATRMGAVRLIDDSYFEDVKQIAFDESEAITLRMAALHTAHQFSKGDALFEEELRQTFLESDSDKRLQLLVNNLLKQ